MGMEQIIVAFESPKSCEPGPGDCGEQRNGLLYRLPFGSGGQAHGEQAARHTVVCGFKLPDESAEDLFADLPSSCAMLMVAVQNLLDLCQTDDIFKLASPVSRGDLTASVRCCCRWGTGWRSSPGPSGAEKSRPSSRKPRGFSWSGTA